MPDWDYVGSREGLARYAVVPLTFIIRIDGDNSIILICRQENKWQLSVYTLLAMDPRT